MGLWGRGSSLFLPAATGQRTDALFLVSVSPHSLSPPFLCCSSFCPCLFIFSLLFLFPFPSHSVQREWCFGSHVIVSQHNCRCLSLADFSLKEHWFPGWRGNGGTTLLFSSAAPPPPLPIRIALSRPLSVSPTGCGRSGSPWARQRQWQPCVALLPAPSLLLFHQAGSHWELQTAAGEWNKRPFCLDRRVF